MTTTTAAMVAVPSYSKELSNVLANVNNMPHRYIQESFSISTITVTIGIQPTVSCEEENVDINVSKIMDYFNTDDNDGGLKLVNGMYVHLKPPSSFKNCHVFIIYKEKPDFSQKKVKKGIKFSVMLFTTLKINLTGCKSLEDAGRVGSIMCSLFGAIYDREFIMTSDIFNVQLINCNFRIANEVDMFESYEQILKNRAGIEDLISAVTYNKQQHAGIIIKSCHGTIIIFKTGCVIMTGFRSLATISAMFMLFDEILHPVLSLLPLVDDTKKKEPCKRGRKRKNEDTFYSDILKRVQKKHVL